MIAGVTESHSARAEEGLHRVTSLRPSLSCPATVLGLARHRPEQTLARMWKKGNPHMLLVECTLESHYGDQHGGSSENYKQAHHPYDTAIPLLGIYLKELK
jgi:hypothetical protein